MRISKPAAKGSPGKIIRYLRDAHEWSYQDLADKCNPTLNRSTVMRIEKNDGYTQDSLKRVATALKVKPEELFYPIEIADILTLEQKSKNRIIKKIHCMILQCNNNQVKTNIPKSLEVPDGYSVTNSGVYFGSNKITNTPVWVLANTNTNGQDWGKKLNWLSQGNVETVVIGSGLLHVSNHTFIDMFQHLGITVLCHPLKLKQYIAAQTPLEPTIEAMQDIQLLRCGKNSHVHYATST